MKTIAIHHGANRQRDMAVLAECLRNREPFKNRTESFRGDYAPTGPIARGWLEEPPYPSLPVYIVWSYDTPIAWVENSGQWVVTKQRFSQTTGRHQSALRMALSEVLS
jgi:hypothetical protein